MSTRCRTSHPAMRHSFCLVAPSFDVGGLKAECWYDTHLQVVAVDGKHRHRQYGQGRPSDSASRAFTIKFRRLSASCAQRVAMLRSCKIRRPPCGVTACGIRLPRSLPPYPPTRAKKLHPGGGGPPPVFPHRVHIFALFAFALFVFGDLRLLKRQKETPQLPHELPSNTPCMAKIRTPSRREAHFHKNTL